LSHTLLWGRWIKQPNYTPNGATDKEFIRCVILSHHRLRFHRHLAQDLLG
jgi:hypothetical protein